jgi:methylenetetrahydrofolate--tRNA-(uracil-5-)-methyltransferase
MKPLKRTPAHHADGFAELVCSNSLRGAAATTAPGLLKEEMRRLGSFIIECADATKVEAGGALAVDRQAFSALVTERITAHPMIRVAAGEVVEVPEPPMIIATGPLTSEPLASRIRECMGGTEALCFFDAAAPIVSHESIDLGKAFFASRYGKGTPDYINCPLTQEEYLRFRGELANAKEAELHGFEDSKVFEGCVPVEVLARRGEDTLRYGPLKPVGLTNPDGSRPYAVVQLRKDNAAGSLYNLVGFQTHLTFGEQRRVFSMIPALRNAEYVRYGVMHRNTYLDSPRLLTAEYADRREPLRAFAGQMTGVEGYVESAASGLTAGAALARRLLGLTPITLPPETAIGALGLYAGNPSVVNFQPMNVNFGLLPPLEGKHKGKRERVEAYAARALQALETIRDDFTEVDT